MRKTLSFLDLIVSTIFLAIVAIVVSLFDRSGARVHRIARLWASIHLRVSGIDVFLRTPENLPDPPFLLMSNHQSSLDITVLLAAIPFSFKFIAKRELFRIPFFGWGMKRAGYISIDRENPREALGAIEEAVSRIREGTPVLIFPEGTRGTERQKERDRGLLPFMKGAFSLASRAGVPVVPLVIDRQLRRCSRPDRSCLLPSARDRSSCVWESLYRWTGKGYLTRRSSWKRSAVPCRG